MDRSIPPASAIKVMVVDDQNSMRKMICQTLRDLGFRDVRDKSSATEALHDIRAYPVHLIISDYIMPDVDGLQFLEEVRKDERIGNTPFIMLTGLTNRDLVEKAAALGVSNFLVKPFAPAALKEKIDRLFGTVN